MTPAPRNGVPPPDDDPHRAVRGIINGLKYSLCFFALVVLLVAALLWPGFARADQTTPGPKTPAPGLVQAKRQCSDSTPLVECRAALRRALAAIAWHEHTELELARQMVGKLTAWTCIHRGEGSWTDTRDPYWGGLQMDRPFMREYGADMLQRHHGGLANVWTPREQIVVAQRAFVQGRGYTPWPVTARHCGLL